VTRLSALIGTVDGLALGLQFNPIAAMAGAVVAAALAGWPKAPRVRVAWAWIVLAVAWAVGDGIRIAGSAVSDPRYGPAYVAVAMWSLVGFAVGYAAPALAGMFVGRRVTHGTGWLSAAAVALTVSLAMAVLAPRLADGVRFLAGG
jgi:hypothetical protein